MIPPKGMRVRDLEPEILHAIATGRTGPDADPELWAAVNHWWRVCGDTASEEVGDLVRTFFEYMTEGDPS